MTKVKICGITNFEDALISAKFGADALGFNFYRKSPRYISPAKAREIIDQLPKEILKVGVFVNESLEIIFKTATVAKLDAIQLHGEETPEVAGEVKAKTNLEIIKAFRVSPEFKPENVLQYKVDAVLLDAYSPKEHGGTGETFDWEIAKKVQEIFPKMYLAGGLSHENIRQAFSATKSFAVDVCSQVEELKGKKDKVKLISFLVKAKSKLNKDSPKSFYNLLSAIHLRPLMYLDKKSLIDLRNFLAGFKIALNFSESAFSTGKYFTDEIRYFGEKIGYGYPNTIDCMTHILRKFDNDEEKSFDYFFALLEEFKLEKEDLSNE